MEEFNKILNSRASVRSFLDTPVEREKIMALIDCAVKAPTACNMQEWRFTVVTDKVKMRNMVDAGGGRVILSSPCGLLVSYAANTKNTLYRDNVQSAAAAIEHILLAAPQLGLGTCWVCNLPSKGFLRKLFGIHPKFEPIAYVLLGYPKQQTKPMPLKRRIDEIVGWNTFPTLPEDKGYSAAKTLVIRFAVWCYRCAPSFIKTAFLNRLVDARFTKKFKKGKCVSEGYGE